MQRRWRRGPGASSSSDKYACLLDQAECAQASELARHGRWRGVYRRSIEGAPIFVEVPAPTDEALHAVLHKIIARTMKLLTRRGVLIEEQGSTYLADRGGDSDEARTLRPLQAAACTYRIAFGPRAGQKVLTLQDTRTIWKC